VKHTEKIQMNFYVLWNEDLSTFARQLEIRSFGDFRLTPTIVMANVAKVPSKVFQARRYKRKRSR